MYRVRIAIGTLLLSLIGTVLWFDLRMETDIGTLLVLGLVVLGSFDEFLCMFKVRRGFRVLGALLAMTSLLGIWGVEHARFEVWSLQAALFFGIFCLLFWSMREYALEKATDGNSEQGEKFGIVGESALVALGWLYLVLGLSHLLLLRFMDMGERGFGRPEADGIALLLFLILVAKGADIGGYLVGKRFGRKKLIPSISPGKSVEGTLGGLFLSAFFAFCFARWVPPVTALLNPVSAVGFGVLVGLSSLIGDLTESFFKRKAGIKDSKTLIPEFGGFFDLTDSLTFAAPLVYYSLRGLST